MDVALLILRVVLGFYLFGHGAQKFGRFGGLSLRQTAGIMGSRLGFRPPLFWTTVAALGETGGAILIFLGVLGPIGPLAAAATMLVATLTHLPKGVFMQNGGVELPFMYLTVAVALALTGPGAFSMDALVGIALPEPVTLAVGAALALLGALAPYASRGPTLHVAHPAAG